MKSKVLTLLTGLLLVSSMVGALVVYPYERSVNFSGYEWEVRKNDVLEGPGPNYFSDSSSNVWLILWDDCI